MSYWWFRWLPVSELVAGALQKEEEKLRRPPIKLIVL